MNDNDLKALNFRKELKGLLNKYNYDISGTALDDGSINIEDKLNSNNYVMNDSYEVKVTEENGEKYIEVAEKSEINKDRIEELKSLIIEDKVYFQNSVNKYMCSLDAMDGHMVEQYLKKLRYHVQELNLWEGKGEI